MPQSRKRAYTLAVSFTQLELTQLWEGCSKTPKRKQPSNRVKVVGDMLLSVPQLARALDISVKELARLLRGAGGGAQSQFDSFLEDTQEAFAAKRAQFEKTWDPTTVAPPKPITKPTTKALAIPKKYHPRNIVLANELPKELERKMGYNVFGNIAALCRAVELSRGTLVRIRDGRGVRQSSKDRVLALLKLTTRTIVRKLKAQEE